MKKICISHYSVRIPRGIPSPTAPFTIVFLADFHNDARLGRKNEGLLKTLERLNPKAVLLGGDMILAKFGRKGTDHALELVQELTARFPVYAINGNHEERLRRSSAHGGETYAEYEQALRDAGVCILENSCKSLRINHTRLTLWGLCPDLNYYHAGKKEKLNADDVHGLLGDPDEDSLQIVLAHSPQFFEGSAGWGADLTLSGHIHGGLIRLPFIGGVVGPGPVLFPKYDKGLYKKDGKRMIVTTGLSAHTIRIRLNNPPEIVALDIL